MGLFDIFGTGDQQAAAQAQISGINQGIGNLNNYYGKAGNQLQTNYAAGLQPFQQNFATGTQGTTAYGNALGVNGPQGSQQAMQAFQNNPGYGFQQQQGNNALLAQNAASGTTGSGKEATDLSKFNQGLAGTSWNNYVSGLSPYLGMAQNSAAGIGSMYGQLGNQMSSLLQSQGNANYGADTSIGNANANADLAGLTASANGLNALQGGASALFGFLSDERVKDDIEPVGALADGQPIYRFRYHGDPRFQIGLLAQDVEQVEPGAVVDDFVGDLKGVDYRRATEYAANLMRFADTGNDNSADYAFNPEQMAV
jgi:Chaperone of endosialidase